MQIFLVILAVVLLFTTLFLLGVANESGKRIFSLSYAALLAGLIFEYRRICGKWIHVLWTTLGAYALSFIAFLPGKRETNYDFEEHLQVWPYYFLFIFIIIAIATYSDEVTDKISEGITLLLTLAINYWIIATDLWHGSYVAKFLIIVNVLFSLFSVYNAFTYKDLSKGNQLTLSIWSSVIIMILSIDNIARVLTKGDIEDLTDTGDAAFVFLQYFLLGVSSVYIVQNFFMLSSYLPSRGGGNSIVETNEAHLARYSDEQVYIVDALFVFILGATVFTMNYFFQFLPINIMIWAMLVATPILLYLIHRLIRT